jgi:DNA-binding transcriptional regulator YhcF (GntR family)
MSTSKHIKIDENSRVPKYRQIVDSIIDNISIGNFKINDKIPSINSFSEEFYLSRDTVEKAYNILKKEKIIISIRGKGNYIARTELLSKINILFLVNKMSSYKMNIYNSFIKTLGINHHTDLHIYHCDESLFLNLLKKNIGGYDYYVIMPHFKTEELLHISKTNEITKAIGNIPSNKLIILDNFLDIDKEHTEIYQDFLIYPEKSHYPYPKRILHGFRKFCVKYNLDFEILDEIYNDIILKKGDLFITIEESDLVSLIKQIQDNEYVLGKEIGVISYNDTPLKDLLGITVISTDFKKMGNDAAKMILKKENGKIKNPFNFIDRDSI